MVYCSKCRNVIILEDSPGIRMILEEAVQGFGFAPSTGESRQEFLELYETLDYFAVILDNQVPYDRNGKIVKDVGVTIAPQLLRKEPGLRVALHTGDDVSSRLGEFERIGLVYLPKPVSMDRLREFLAI
jgi:DNA-binding NtrC family response regulator